MPEERSDMTVADPTAVLDATLGDLPSVTPSQDVLVLAWGGEAGRGPEWMPLKRGGVELGREMEGFPGGKLADGRMSRRHAAIRRARGQWAVEDLGSRNGTRLDGRRLDGTAPLEPGSVLRLGGSLFVLAHRKVAAAALDDAELVGSSGAMDDVRRAVAAVAAHPNSVLLTGETGTGKEVVAGALHRASGRAGRFVAVNCGAVSEGVLESELFGHRKGAFTGAVADKDGLFAAADGGTLFLDEVGEMPEGLQVRLLRVLETRTVRPIGSTRERAVDVRVVAATNRDLVQEVRLGKVRSDLFARLNQWPVHLPPLRERREDIPELSRALLARRGEGRALSLGLLEALLVHRWTLNVRGLANVLGVAAIASPAGQPLELTEQVAAMLEADRAMAEPVVDPAALMRTMPTIPMVKRPSPTPDADAVAEALRASNGSVAAAARAVGASRQQIYRLIESEGWDLDTFRE